MNIKREQWEEMNAQLNFLFMHGKGIPHPSVA